MKTPRRLPLKSDWRIDGNLGFVSGQMTENPGAGRPKRLAQWLESQFSTCFPVTALIQREAVKDLQGVKSVGD
ncbi:hypothetical protein GCM10027051_16540 [Niabella terrae]